MSRYFSKVIDRYFCHWIKPFTWHTRHSADRERFYQFLKAVKRYSRKERWTEGLRENILTAAKEYHPQLDENYVAEVADSYVDGAKAIFDYESVMFPHPLIEITGPDRAYLYLRSLEVCDADDNLHKMYSPEEAEAIVTRNFGEDWRKRNKPKEDP